jgi:hypothetical protein
MVRRKNPTHPLGHAGLNYAYDVVIIDGSHGVKEGSHPLGHAGLNYTYDVVIVDGSHGVKDGSPYPLGHAGLNYAYDVVIIDGSHGVKEGSHPSVRSCRTKLCLRCRHHRWLPWWEGRVPSIR